MAIGSAPEYGITFRQFGQLTPEQHQQWYDHIKRYGPTLLDGYGTLHYQYPIQDIPPLALTQGLSECLQSALTNTANTDGS